MAVPAWAAITLASWGIAAYAVVAYGEALGFWPHAPDHPELAALAPSVRDATNTVLLLAMFVAISTAVLIRIVRALNLREEELRKANLRLEELSQQDPLTLLYNRRYFVRRAQEELERVRRGHSLALLMMDLDGFKQVNDRFGHLTGDEVLKSIALALTSSLRSVDVLGRYGGDEFVVLLTDTDEEEAALVAKRLNTKIREASARVAPASPVTASVGIAMARADHDVTILLNLADDAAYRAKQAGGNRHSLAPAPAIDDEGGASSGLRASNAG